MREKQLIAKNKSSTQKLQQIESDMEAQISSILSQKQEVINEVKEENERLTAKVVDFDTQILELNKSHS